MLLFGVLKDTHSAEPMQYVKRHENTPSMEEDGVRHEMRNLLSVAHWPF